MKTLLALITPMANAVEPLPLKNGESVIIAESACTDWYANLPKSSQQGQIVACSRPSCESR